MKSAPSPNIDIPNIASSVFEKFIAAEYAYFSASGAPLCWPVTPYWYPDREVLGVATGLAYPNKADCAVRNPKVAMLFSDPTSSSLLQAPQIYVEGSATVLNEDLQGNTDRYVREIRNKFVVARLALNPISVKFLDFYLPRIWVEITPEVVEIRQPFAFAQISESATRSGSAPYPESPLDSIERNALDRVVSQQNSGVLITRGRDGYPSMERVSLKSSGDGTVVLGLREEIGEAQAALSIHHHSFGGTRFKAYMVRGTVAGATLVANRLLGFFGNGSIFPLSVVPEVAKLRRNLRRELRKRGLQMPQLRVP